MYKIIVGKPYRKRRPSIGKRMGSDINTDLKAKGCAGVDWIQLAHYISQCRFINTSSLKAGNLLTSYATISFLPVSCSMELFTYYEFPFSQQKKCEKPYSNEAIIKYVCMYVKILPLANHILTFPLVYSQNRL
jgi:hypothetical protein